MQICRVCSWCEQVNDLTAAKQEGVKAYCSNCQHRADIEQGACDCSACKAPAQSKSDYAGNFERKLAS